MGNMAGLRYEDVMPGKTDILAISVNKPYGDFTFIQIELIELIAENADRHIY